MGGFRRQSVLIILMLASTQLRGSKGDYSCDPEQDCSNAAVGDKVPDPDDCNKYYLCIENEGEASIFPTDNPISCPTGQYFNTETGECDDENGKACDDNCLNICISSCETDYQEIVYPGDCTKYYVCIPGTSPIIVECSPGTYFDGTDCTSNIAHCCDNCTPYCSSPYKEILDPFDCHSYYVCSSQGIPTASDHYACPEEQYFEPSAGRCEDIVPETPCENLCPNSTLY